MVLTEFSNIMLMMIIRRNRKMFFNRCLKVVLVVFEDLHNLAGILSLLF